MRGLLGLVWFIGFSRMDDIRIVTDFPRQVREIANTWIPMADGTRLAARIWLPVAVSNESQDVKIEAQDVPEGTKIELWQPRPVSS